MHVTENLLAPSFNVYTLHTVHSVQLRIRNRCELSSNSPNRRQYCSSKYFCKYSDCICALPELWRNLWCVFKTACLGGRIYSIPFCDSCYALDALNYGMNCTRMILRKWWVHFILQNRPRQNSQHGKELNKFFPTNKSDDLCLFFCLYPSLCTLYTWPAQKN